MMKFVKVDEDAYEVTVNLDTIRRIGELQGDERNEVIGTSFQNAHERLSQPEATEVAEEVTAA
ncbi:hypothetical protein SEA_COMRADE_156 [Streptomyces phage Comrade]|uniref:Uncharacterized protein n=1 Tax=Streptomyces phage Comrade TaxID=2301714 RepID=A0A385DV79_9CAUD|nr:hypothetical protein HWB84_gp115 [Streptomyces phage Comrade]AXQ63400.1 hypothetical protein SEA_COMRADE_156 [Streptomyces phage Comrade]